MDKTTAQGEPTASCQGDENATPASIGIDAIENPILPETGQTPDKVQYFLIFMIWWFHCFMISYYHETMKKKQSPSPAAEEYLQIQVPAITKTQLGIRSVETREPVRVIVLRALQAYGVQVPKDAIIDRRRNRS